MEIMFFSRGKRFGDLAKAKFSSYLTVSSPSIAKVLCTLRPDWNFHFC